MTIIKPRRLSPGDLIGILAPASPVADPSRIERGVRYLERNGYRALVAGNVGKARGYLAGTDQERVADMHSLFGNPEVKAILCARGGYGTPRLLSMLDYRLIARNPKIFVGYSDITAMQLAIWKKCGLVTYQGPMLAVDLYGEVDPFAEEWFWKILTSRGPLGMLPIDAGTAIPVRTGKARGRLLGGNLALLCAIVGTRYQPDFSGAMLFLEDTDEEPYRIDRMFTQLRHASILERSTGILLGQFTDSEPKDPAKPSLTLAEAFEDAASWSSIPILSNLPFGHIPRKLTIPIGIRARFDAEARTVELTEAAVR
jgi:muramoyltetrapeptide carboxypeptidase